MENKENIYNGTLDDFLINHCVDVSKTGKLFYSFYYKNIPCVGHLYITPVCELLIIKPIKKSDVINQFAGESISIYFNKDKWKIKTTSIY